MEKYVVCRRINIKGIYCIVTEDRNENLDFPGKLERTETINNCIFNVVSTYPYGFEPPAANRHYGGAGVAFLDGHGEIHHWQTTNLLNLPITGLYQNGGIAGGGITPDFLWLRTRMTRATTDTW